MQDRLGTIIQKGDLIVDMAHKDHCGIGVALGTFTPLSTKVNYLNCGIWYGMEIRTNEKLRTHHVLVIHEAKLNNLIEKLVINRLRAQVEIAERYPQERYPQYDFVSFTEVEIREKIQSIIDMSRALKEEL